MHFLDCMATSKGTKKVDKVMCFRCDSNGHFAIDCMTVLFIYYEMATHEAKDCHLLSMLKPMAMTYGLCRSELLFYEVLVSADIKLNHDSGIGRIAVEGGSMTAHEVVKELE